jgi:hypothetical protein
MAPGERDCGDGVDNDHDGATDCDDADCETSPDCGIFPVMPPGD